jgi:DNA-binding NarL/FixJ family response regulator
MMSEEQIKIAIADDENLFREGVTGLLETESDITFLFEAENGKTLLYKLQMFKNNLPHIILMDLKMPEMNGVECTRIVKKKYPEVKIIALSSYFSKSFILNMIDAGVVAYLAKDCQRKELLEAIHQVYHQGYYYDKVVMELINENLLHGAKTQVKSTFDKLYLTKKEKEVLALICAQYTTQEIADKLFISPRTVDGHRNNLLQKTGCKNTAGLVVFAIQNGVIDIDDLKPL